MAVAVRGRGFVIACSAVMILLGTVSSASALDFSVGGGGFLTPYGTFGGIKGTTNESGVKVRMENVMDVFQLGAYVFLDVSDYAEVSLGISTAHRNHGDRGVVIEVNGVRNTTSEMAAAGSIHSTDMNIGVLGKYPFSLIDKLTLYPAAGVEYIMCLSGWTYDVNDKEKEVDVEDIGDYNNLWIKFGVGGDYQFLEKIFARAQILYGIGLPGEFSDDPPKGIKKVWGSTFTFKVGVGYNL